MYCINYVYFFRFKNSPIVKKSSSSVTLCSKDDEIENLRMFDSKTAENILNSKNNISPLKVKL